MPLLGYGEDALTLWALTRRLPALLEALGNPTPPADALVVFRPSFGRRGAAPDWAEGRALSAQFGEFDAVLATAQGVALIEAKRGTASELQGGMLALRPEQRRRHAVFAWYLRAWAARGPSGWRAFRDAAGPEFRAAFPGMELPPAGVTIRASRRRRRGRSRTREARCSGRFECRTPRREGRRRR